MPNSKVFISYAREDAVNAEALCALLDQKGILNFLDRTNIPPGRSISDTVERELRTASHVILLLSDKTITKPWPLLEIQVARECGIAILQVRLSLTQSLPIRWRLVLGDDRHLEWLTDVSLEEIAKQILGFIGINDRRNHSLHDVVISVKAPFLNRRKLREAFAELLEPDGTRILLLEGYRGVGKSYTAELVRHTAQSNVFGAVVPSSAGLRELRHLTDELTAIADFSQLGQPPVLTTPDRYALEYFKWMIAGLRKAKLPELWVLVFDGFKVGAVSNELLDVAKRIVAELVAGRHSDFLRVVLIDSPELMVLAEGSLHAGSELLEFGDIQENHALDYVRQRGVELSDAVLAAVHMLWTHLYENLKPPEKLSAFSRGLMQYTANQLKKEGLKPNG